MTIRSRLTLMLCFISVALLSMSIGHAQPKNGRAGMRGMFGPHAQQKMHHMDRIGKHLIPPRLIMRHMDKLNLSEDQINQLKTLMKATQNQALDLEIDLNQAMGKLENLLKESGDQDVTLAQADRVMSVESKLKRTRLALALQVKRLLTSDQLKIIK